MRTVHSILFFLFSMVASAQQELLLNTLPDLWHASSLNPAFFPADKRIAIGLPGLALDAAHSGDITYRDLFVKKNGRTAIDFGNVIQQLDDNNEAFFDQRIETLSLGLRLPGKLVLSAAHANRLTGSIAYPKSLPELIWNGNAPYIGKTVEVGLDANVFDWNEWSVGVSKSFLGLRIGARAKVLSGISALRTDPTRAKASLFTSSDIYQLTLNTDYAFHASSLISAIDTAGLGFDLDLADLGKRSLFSRNTGFAFDLGAQFSLLDERLTLSAAALDLGGKITWKEQANYFHSKGAYTYDGVTFPGADLLNNGENLDFGNKLDTLNDLFQFKKTASEFKTALPTRYYLGGTLRLTETWSVGLSVFHQTNESDRRNTAVGGSLRWKPMHWVSLGAMYSVNDRSAANLGFHAALTPGPVQVYFTSDNLLGAFSVKNSPAVNLRAGVALVL
jgi:Family of unknown function (DUF5723)